MIKYDWAVNPTKEARAIKTATDMAKAEADANKKPFKAPSESEVKDLYIKYGGLLGVEAIEKIEGLNPKNKEEAIDKIVKSGVKVK